MHKVFRRILMLALSGAMILQLFGCGGAAEPAASTEEVASSENDAQGQAEQPTLDGIAQIWSAPSTVKIDQNDIEYANKGEAKLSYNAVKNEYENHQLMITAASDIDSYYLETADLTCGTNVLSADNFTVYNEKYIKYAESSYGSYSMPDALVPQDAAKAHDELRAAADHNAGLWVTVYVPEDTPAGTYEGSFKLTVQDVETEIPVSVTVNDYVLPRTTRGQSLFSWRYDRVGAGELDSSIEMMDFYYQFFLDYRISLQSLPLESNDPAEIKRVLEKYYDTLSTYSIGPDPGRVWGGEVLTYADDTKKMIYTIAEMSGPEKNYFDKAMLYVVDEPDLRDENTLNATLRTIESVNGMLRECVDYIRNDSTGRFSSFKSIKGWDKSITDIPNIMPLPITQSQWTFGSINNPGAEKYLSALNTVCPIFEAFNDQLGSKVLAACEKYGIENIWWYGCNGPLAPYGNYHLGDKNLLGPRTVSWIQAKYGIEGNLYWDAAAYTSEKPNWDQYMDVYTNPMRIEGSTAGDGYLTYPGRVYDIYGPIPSVRLMAIRDGMEELEMLYALEDQYKELEGAYGSGFSARRCITSLVDKVSYNGSALYADGEKGLVFDDVRASLIDSIVWNNMGIGFALSGYTLKNNIALVSYYVSDTCKVYVGDELQQSVEGCRYEYELDLNENTSIALTIEAADGTRYDVLSFIAYPTKTLQSFEDAAVTSAFTTTEGGSVVLSSDAQYATEGNSAHITLSGVITGNELLDATFVPSVSMSTDILENITDLSEVDAFRMDFYNALGSFKVRVKVYSGTAFVTVGEYTIDSGHNSVNVVLSDVSFSAMAQADRIVFEFDNSSDGVTANTYDFYIDEIVATE